MSVYASVALLISNSLTPESAANFSNTAMQTALEVASADVDSYLRSQQILPLTDWDGKISQVTTDLAAYRLWVSYGFNPDAPQMLNVVERYRDARAWLDMVAKQLIIVDYPDSSGSNPKAGPFVRTSTSPVGFARICNYRRWFR